VPLPALPAVPAADDASRFCVFICEVEGELGVVAAPEVEGDVVVPVDPVVPVVAPVEGCDEPVVPPEVLPVVPCPYAVPTASAMASVSADNAAREVFMRSLLVLVNGPVAGLLLLQHARQSSRCSPPERARTHDVDMR
jgi:hypothetical protein